MGLSKQLAKRLEAIEIVLAEQPIRGHLDVVEAIPLAHARGRPLGLHQVGPPGSTAAALVYDPADGHPTLVRDERTRGAIFIVCESTSFQPGIDYFE